MCKTFLFHCFQEENFGLAKRAHFAQTQLKMALSDMEELENAKRRAVKENDFDHAEELNDEMKALKKHYLTQIDQRLLEDVPVGYPSPISLVLIITRARIKIRFKGRSGQNFFRTHCL